MEKYGVDWLLSQDDKYRYQYLSRLQKDCNYYLGAGNRHPKHLPGGDVKKHLETMKVIWKSFPENAKPEWLSWEQIEQYQKDMESG